MINEYLSYNSDTGDVTWLKSRGTIKAGRVAGTPDIYGYCCIKINYKIYKAHRIAWYLQTGVFPEMEIDHINGDTSDNRWSNLRQCTHRENMNNAKNNNDFVGVHWSKRDCRWYSQALVGGNYSFLGSFKTHLAACMSRHQFNLGIEV